ncbi:MAG: AAA family ATPase [Promethearchaeota archaeon]
MVQELEKISIDLKKYIKVRYFNTQPVIKIKDIVNCEPVTLEFTLPDMLLIAAITHSSILLRGSSGSGKTDLAELIARFLFGEDGFTRKNITPDMNEQDFMDRDFGAIKEGKKFKEALLADKLFMRPALIIDEANRAPPVIQNRLMQILENSTLTSTSRIQSNKIEAHW